jgi:DNA-binding NarL/FixJ family response regulator
MSQPPRLAVFAAGSSHAARRPVTVVIAEDHRHVRASLRRLLDADPAVVVRAEAADLALTRRHVAHHRPDVLVLDLRMPDRRGLTAICEILQGAPATSVVVLSSDGAPGLAHRALQAGASGYVLKDRAAEELPEAIAAAAAGRQYVSGAVAARLAHRRPAGS